LWKRASSKAAFITLISGIILGFITFYLDWNNIYRGDFMLMAFWLCVACFAIMVAATLVFPETLKAEAEPLVWKNWREPFRGETGGRGLGNYRLASLAVLIVFVTLYLVFY
jgi:hypothetical protein